MFTASNQFRYREKMMTSLVDKYSASNALCVRHRQIMRMVRRREIPFIELPNGEIRFRLTTLDRWVSSREQVPKPQGAI